MASVLITGTAVLISGSASEHRCFQRFFSFLSGAIGVPFKMVQGNSHVGVPEESISSLDKMVNQFSPQLLNPHLQPQASVNW